MYLVNIQTAQRIIMEVILSLPLHIPQIKKFLTKYFSFKVDFLIKVDRNPKLVC